MDRLIGVLARSRLEIRRWSEWALGIGAVMAVMLVLDAPVQANAGEVHFNMYNYVATWLDEEGEPKGECRAHSTDPNLDGENMPPAPGDEECDEWENKEKKCVEGEAHSDPRAGWVPSAAHQQQSGCSGTT